MNNIKNASEFKELVTSIRTNRKENERNIQTALLTATFYAYRKDCKVDGNATATEVNSLYDAVGVSGNRIAVAKWLIKYSPVYHSKTGFEISKQKQKECDLFAHPEEEARAMFWDYAVTSGMLENWYEMDDDSGRVESLFDLDKAKKSVDALIKKLNGAQYGDVADALKSAFDHALLERAFKKSLAEKVAASELSNA